MITPATTSLLESQKAYKNFIATQKASLLNYLAIKPRNQEEKEQLKIVHDVGQAVVRSLLYGDVNVADLGTTPKPPVPALTWNIPPPNISVGEMLKRQLQNQAYLQNQPLLFNLLSSPSAPIPPSSYTGGQQLMPGGTNLPATIEAHILAHLAQYYGLFSENGYQFPSSLSAIGIPQENMAGVIPKL
ncbi:hypothetical protein GCK72_007103 [Caenorhabditis remanei]|uniref:Uncharacterized protein n=1 Tax=Caenorhabditis remanei TaxID=31234 RepID=A0A6A5HKM2_CAERE|nr:hypothetical protein GCK72_007103 [Caenorhabditis remanei]KAF1767144.1 hypothetical protein GCK72_007103 [Caenorhabditis remanei]